MGYSLHSVDKLGAPYLLVDEAVFVIPKGSVLSLEKHHFKLLFILNGEIEHEIQGLHQRQTLSPGDILLAPLVHWHNYINPNKGKAVSMQVLRIFLDADFLADRAASRIKKPETDWADFIVRHFNRVVQLRGGMDNEISVLIRNFRRETELRTIGYRHRIRSICTDLIVAVARKLEPERHSPGLKNEHPIVAAAKEYILKHHANDLTLGEIAWHAGKGEEYLARVFKRETGQSVFDCVRETRIDRAKTLLLNPSKSLTEIATDCGFKSLSFFSRTFRQQAGMTPSHYRQYAGTIHKKHVLRHPGYFTVGEKC